MTKLNEVMDTTRLAQLIATGYVSRRQHDRFPLAILNYTAQAQYDAALEWGPELNLARGLIFNVETEEIVARPFAKFWNFNDERHPETLLQNLPSENPIVTDKLDGSLGILYSWEGQNYVATRGSFHSDQAEWATAWLRRHAPALELPASHTVCCEIIYPENRIVVDYDFRGLVVLSIVHRQTGLELNRGEVRDWSRAVGLDVVPDFRKTLAECAAENIEGREGYVLTYPSSGLKIKVKFEEYVRLHRMLFGLNPKSIWEMLSGSPESRVALNRMLADNTLPAGFRDWLIGWTQKLNLAFAEIDFRSGQMVYEALQIPGATRRNQAEFFNNSRYANYSSVCFAKLDHKLSDEVIWRMIKPRATDSFKTEGE